MKTIVVTGANRGIGLEHVRQTLLAGDMVIAACRVPREAAALHALAKDYPNTLKIEALDVANGASVAELADRLSDIAIDVLINNAGLYGGNWESGAQRHSIEGMDYGQWEEIMRINVMGPFRITAALLPHIKAGTRKLIVMMSSDLGSIAENKQGQSHAYRSSKAALNMLTKGLSIELKDQGITVVSMAPGWTQTELGGPSATWPVNESVSAQRTVLADLSLANTGVFIDLTGRVIPW